MIWFRLPTQQDRRAWRYATWEAVRSLSPLLEDVRTTLTSDRRLAGGGPQALWNLHVENRGNIDAAIPSEISVSGNCGSFDGVNGYRAERGPADVLRWIGSDVPLLAPGLKRSIGWLRCADNPIVLARGEAS